MKTFVIFASCLAVTSVAGRSNSRGNGGYSAPASGGGSSSNGGYSAPSSGGSSGSGGYSGGSNGGGGFGNANAFGNSGLTMSSLLSLVGGGGGFGQAGNGGGFGRGSSGGFGGSVFGGSASGIGGGQGATRGGGLGAGNGGGAGASGQLNQQGGQVRRFVSVHVAPEEDTPREARIIRAGGDPDTHVNIIFVKAPSGGSEQQTEVVLPEPPKQKTLVYVLIRRPTEGENDVKIRAPAPTKPSKPEVYFIRYKPEGDATAGADVGNGPSSGSGLGNGLGGGSGFGGGSSGGVGLGGNDLGLSYGAPSQQQNGGGSNGGGYQ